MNISIESNFQFSVASIQYAPSGELLITLTSDNSHADVQYQYTACLGDGQAEEKPSVSLMQYAIEYTDVMPTYYNTVCYNAHTI